MKTASSVAVAFVACLFASEAFAQGGALKASDPVKIELKVPAEDAANVSATYIVSETGHLKMPYLDREIPAAGLSVSQLSRRIEAAYREANIYTNPTVIVAINAPPGAAHVVTVGGEVRKPGEIPLRDGMRLYNAIQNAGGFTEFADPRRVKLIRGAQSTIHNLRQIGTDHNNPLLKDGDTIHVPPD
jgi:polysaccharide export outer membrane protein